MPYHYCACGQRSAQLLTLDLFPSKPIRGSIAFDLSVLKLLHEQLLYGVGRIYAWARGLRSYLQAGSPTHIPNFYRHLLDAYHNWRAVVYYADVYTSEYLFTSSDGTKSWEAGKLENQCPACFNFLDHETTHPAFVSVDGNMQLRRFKDVKDAHTEFREYEELPTSLFLSVDRRFYGNAQEDDPADDENMKPSVEDGTSVPDTSCESQFKATRGWESKTGNTKELKSLAAFHETGVMGMVCRHGCTLRYTNMYTGERARHAITLLQGLLYIRPDISEIRCCYDVTCIFSTAVKVHSP